MACRPWLTVAVLVRGRVSGRHHHGADLMAVQDVRAIKSGCQSISLAVLIVGGVGYILYTVGISLLVWVPL